MSSVDPNAGGEPHERSAPSLRHPRWNRWLVVAVAVLGLTLVGLLLRPFLAPRPAPPTPDAAPTYPRFAKDDVYSVDLRNAPIDARSRDMVKRLVTDVKSRYNGVATFNAHAYGVHLYRATPATPKVRVGYRDCNKEGYVPDGLYSGAAHFADVPIPAGAVPAKGTDAQLSIWAPHEDKLWEFWAMERRDDGTWHACWGGRLDDVSSNPGFFPPPFGVNASGLVMTGSMVSVADARDLRIDHAVGLAIPRPADDFVYPAQRTDGRDTHPLALPEGARLRLDPDVDVDALPLTPVAKAIARAAQRYGLIVTDRSDGVSIICEGGHDELRRTGADPWKAVLGSTPSYEVMRNFPWDRVQVVRLGYGAPGS